MSGRDREKEARRTGAMNKEAGRTGEVDMGPCFISVSPNPPPTEDRVGQPYSSHWKSEDTKSYSVHGDGY